MAAPVVQSSSSLVNAASQNNAAVPVPSGAASGDIVLVFLRIVNVAQTITAPAGFTLKDSVTAAAPANPEQTLYMFWKRLTASDSGTYTFSWTGFFTRTAAALRISGCIAAGDPTDAYGETFSADTVSSGPLPPVSCTTTVADTLLVWVEGQSNTGVTVTVPATYTQVTGVVQLRTATTTQPAAGATGNVQGSSNAALLSVVIQLAAIAPVAGGAPTARPRNILLSNQAVQRSFSR